MTCFSARRTTPRSASSTIVSYWNGSAKISPRTLVCQSIHFNHSGTLLLPGAPPTPPEGANPQDLIEDTGLLTQQGVLPHSCRLQLL